MIINNDGNKRKEKRMNEWRNRW